MGTELNFKIGISAWTVESTMNPYALVIDNGFVIGDRANWRLNDGDILSLLCYRQKLRFAVNSEPFPKEFTLLPTRYKLTVELFDQKCMELEILPGD